MVFVKALKKFLEFPVLKLFIQEFINEVFIVYSKKQKTISHILT